MATTNTRARTAYGTTYEGGRAAPETGAFSIDPREQLERMVASCMLGESTFYETGDQTKRNIAMACLRVSTSEIMILAARARTEFKLRHAPLFLVVQALKQRKGEIPEERRTIAAGIPKVVRRPDEMGELLSLYWAENERTGTGKTKLPRQLKVGLARAFRNFDAYQLAKWNEPKAVKLRDVLFLTHAKPVDEEQAKLWRMLVEGKLEAPDTWEVALSSGKDKTATWTRLLDERKLGYMALLMNLRNMTEAKVKRSLIVEQLIARAKGSWALPLRFVAAAKANPDLADELGQAMLRSCEGMGKLAGHTTICIDISGSMGATMSAKSQTSRAEAAAALAALIREVCEQATVLVFGTDVARVPNLRGMGLIEKVRELNKRDAVGSGTNIGGAVRVAKDIGSDRIIVVTDEQSHDTVADGWKGYLVNCAPYAPGLPTNRGEVKRVNGLSERILDWIAYEETGKTLSKTEEEGA